MPSTQLTTPAGAADLGAEIQKLRDEKTKCSDPQQGKRLSQSIQQLEEYLRNFEVVDTAELSATGRVAFGATVELLDIESGEELKYQIVGMYEANVEKGKILADSPLARALIGHSTGDAAVYRGMGNVVEFEILKVSYD